MKIIATKQNPQLKDRVFVGRELYFGNPKTSDMGNGWSLLEFLSPVKLPPELTYIFNKHPPSPYRNLVINGFEVSIEVKDVLFDLNIKEPSVCVNREDALFTLIAVESYQFRGIDVDFSEESVTVNVGAENLNEPVPNVQIADVADVEPVVVEESVKPKSKTKRTRKKK